MDLRNLIQNLSKAQKIAILFIVQAFIVIVAVVATSSTLSSTKDRIDTIDNEEILKDVPSDEKALYEQELWNIIAETSDNVNQNIVKDAVIRPESYLEEQSASGTQVSFIVDIDSIQQSYRIILGWSGDGPTTPLIDCLPVSESKYPDSVCYGTYRSSNDISLYLPYQIESPFLDDYPYAGPELYIDGDEDTHTITVVLNPCSNAGEYRKKADDYLKTIPNIKNYKINYVTNDGVDVVCAEGLNGE